MKKSIIAVICLLGLSGCASAVRFPSLTAPEKPHTVYNWNEEVVTEPKLIKTAGDGAVVAQRTEKRLSVGLDTTPKKVSFIERIGNFIGGLSFWIFALVILGLILAPGATIGFLFKKYKQYKNAMKQTVAAIKEARAVDSQALHDALKSKQSTDTKKIVGQIKAGL